MANHACMLSKTKWVFLKQEKTVFNCIESINSYFTALSSFHLVRFLLDKVNFPLPLLSYLYPS